jgi:hypothetical protein
VYHQRTMAAGTHELILPSLARGIYYVAMEGELGIYTEKFIIN